jgi:hypothetical protein
VPLVFDTGRQVRKNSFATWRFRWPSFGASAEPTRPGSRSVRCCGEIMGSIRSGLFVSLDGVVESPETWHFDYFNDETGAAVGALMGGNDAMLLGRQTYEEFAGYWPNADPTLVRWLLEEGLVDVLHLVYGPGTD